MLAGVACACLRTGRKVPVGMFSLLPAAMNWPRSLHVPRNQDVSQPRTRAHDASQPKSGLHSSLPSVAAGPVSRSDSLSHPAGKEAANRDNFGSLSRDISSRRLFRKTGHDLHNLRYGEEDDARTGRGLPGRRNTPYWYFLQCKRLVKENKLQEALDVFSRDMLQGERLQPEEYNYSVLIGACARAGHLKKSFKLYNDMKKRGLVATDATYTALFNACAECPSKRAGLQQAIKLEEELRHKSYPLSTITYHALLKAHAVTNHLQACIGTLREMLEKGHAVTQETFHYLLMSCLKDKATGFRLALQVWRQMLRSGILPDSKNYNLLLRIARDCGIGDPAMASGMLLRSDGKWERDCVSQLKSESECKSAVDIDLLESQLFLQPDPLSSSQQLSGDRDTQSDSGQHSSSLIPFRQTAVDVANDSVAPNLLDIFEGKRSSVVSLGTVDGASDRLALIGGANGFLQKMEVSGLRPDLKTLTLLVDTMEPSLQSLKELLSVSKQQKVKLDVAFFNSAIRRMAKAGDLEGAKHVLKVMKERGVHVDVQTFGCLALACQHQADGLQLLNDMQEVGLKPNVQVFSALIGQGIRRLDYRYLKTLLKSMSSMGVWPNEVIIRQLEFASQYPPNYNQYKGRNNYLIHIDGFRGFYQQWLQVMPAQTSEDERAEPLRQNSTVLKIEATDGAPNAASNQRTVRRSDSQNLGKKSNSAV